MSENKKIYKIYHHIPILVTCIQSQKTAMFKIEHDIDLKFIQTRWFRRLLQPILQKVDSERE